MDEKEKSFNEETEIIRQLVEEVSHKYDAYISIWCFPNSTGIVSSEINYVKKSEGGKDIG